MESITSQSNSLAVADNGAVGSDTGRGRIASDGTPLTKILLASAIPGW
jgi:hypothetical protein